MAFQDKKFLDAEGITHLVKLLDEYPNNQVLGTVIDAIEDELSQKYEKPAGGIPASDLEDNFLTEHQDLSNYVQRTDYATTSDAGIVRVRPTYGLTMDNDTIKIYAAPLNHIKNGAATYTTIVPAHQHESVFYGLAKVAGADEKNSELEVGQYTDAAKTAIQQMLDVPSTSEIPTKVSNLTDDSGHYTKPATGIPASDLEETYVKFDDYATTSTAGVVKVGGLGIKIRDGEIQLSPASDRQIKTNSGDTSPIVAAKGNQVAFYGLANAAGDTTQSQSSNSIGQYTDEAKTAIQNMLDVPSTADIPTNVSELTNDAGYLTKHQDISGKANVADLATVAISGSYEDLSDKPIIPDIQIAGTSIVENGIANVPAANNTHYGVVKVNTLKGISMDGTNTLSIAGANETFIKNGDNTFRPIVPATQHRATFYGLAKAAGANEADSTENFGTYTAAAKAAIQQMLDVPSTSAVTSEIAAAIGNINSFDMAVVQALPTEDISTHTIYLVPKTGETNDVYDEYVYINNAWEMVGNTQIDLSNYVQKTDYATDSDAGVVKVGNGLAMSTNGTIGIQPAPSVYIKAGDQMYNPISPKRQHEATFYGLAKAAGDSTQSQSDNAIGTYTVEARAAIQNMLDVPAKTDIPNLSNYVQKTDYATANAAGVVKIGSGLTISDGAIRALGAGSSDIKTGTDIYKPITSYTTKNAVFYGLAKAAGDATQSQSDNAVGTYTDEAKAAIQQMLDVPSTSDIPDTSIYATKADTVLETTLSKGRKEGTTIGNGSFAFGNKVEASGINSFAVGINTIASNSYAHAEGGYNQATGMFSHAEGGHIALLGANIASGLASHAEGGMTVAAGQNSHTEGTGTKALGHSSHVGGKFNVEDNYSSWPEWAADIEYSIGDKVKLTTTDNETTTVKGYICKTANNDAEFTTANWIKDQKLNYTYIVGNGTADDARSNAYALTWEGDGHYAGDVYVHANTDSTGGIKLATVDDMPLEKGSGSYSAKLKGNIQEGSVSAECKANGKASFAYGLGATAIGDYSIANGYLTVSTGLGSFVTGQLNIIDDYSNWNEWVADTEYVVGDKVKITTTENNETTIMGYICKTANSDSNFTSSKWNVDTRLNYLHIVGNGKKIRERSNAYALDWDGNGHYMGNIYVGANADSSGGIKVATVAELATKLDAAEAGLKVVRLI